MTVPRVYFDACCFIDMLQYSVRLGMKPERANHVNACRKFLEASRAKDAEVFTSVLSLAECQDAVDDSDPSNHKRVLTPDVKRLIDGMLLSTKSGVMPIQATPRIVQDARELYWLHGARFGSMDGIHVASALSQKCNYFVTTDTKFPPVGVAAMKKLGLTLTTADAIMAALPDKYTQLPLTAPPNPSTPAAPPRRRLNVGGAR